MCSVKRAKVKLLNFKNCLSHFGPALTKDVFQIIIKNYPKRHKNDPKTIQNRPKYHTKTNQKRYKNNPKTNQKRKDLA